MAMDPAALHAAILSRGQARLLDLPTKADIAIALEFPIPNTQQALLK